MTLSELKARAIALGLSKEDVRQFGNLSYRATWEAAIADAETAPAPVDESAPEQTEQDDRAIRVYGPQTATQDRMCNQCTLKKSEINHIRHEDEIDPDTLPELKQTDDRFEDWQTWMKIGARFITPNGASWTITHFDKYGNCFAYRDGDDPSWNIVFQIETLTRYVPEADDDTRDKVIEQFRAAGVSDAEIAQLKAAPLSVTGASMILGVLEGFFGPLPAPGVVVSLILSFFALG